MGRDGTVGRPKTKAGYRVVPLVPALRRLLVAWKLRAPHTRPDDLVIGTADGGGVQSETFAARSRLRRNRRAYTRPRGGCRCTRSDTPGRGDGAAMATGGMPATTLARLAGHADAGFTLRVYASDPRDDAAVAASVLSSPRRPASVASQVLSQVSLSSAGAPRQGSGRRRAQRCGFDGSCRSLSARASSLTSRGSQVRALHQPSRFVRARARQPADSQGCCPWRDAVAGLPVRSRRRSSRRNDCRQRSAGIERNPASHEASAGVLSRGSRRARPHAREWRGGEKVTKRRQVAASSVSLASIGDATSHVARTLRAPMSDEGRNSEQQSSGIPLILHASTRRTRRRPATSIPRYVRLPAERSQSRSRSCTTS
jgi:hypothetical protein